jgi:uncharacterized phosphosugar-binding protein
MVQQIAVNEGLEGIRRALMPQAGFARAVGTLDHAGIHWTVTATRYGLAIIGVTIYRDLRLCDRFAASSTYEAHEGVAASIGTLAAGALKWKLQEEG